MMAFTMLYLVRDPKRAGEEFSMQCSDCHEIVLVEVSPRDSTPPHVTAESMHLCPKFLEHILAGQFMGLRPDNREWA